MSWLSEAPGFIGVLAGAAALMVEPVRKLVLKVRLARRENAAELRRQEYEEQQRQTARAIAEGKSKARDEAITTHFSTIDRRGKR